MRVGLGQLEFYKPTDEGIECMQAYNFICKLGEHSK